LERAILALAQPADVQLGLFPDFVCKADELALDFEDGLYELIGHETEITPAQRQAIDALDALLTEKSGEQNSRFWTDEAVQSDPIWERLRILAQAVALEFGWDLRRPPPSDAVYIPVTDDWSVVRSGKK
jgi:hypothetical protein